MIYAKNIIFYQNTNLILNEASFSVGKNYRVGLVGLNGAGKTTLFKLILGELVPLSGIINVHGTISLAPQEIIYDLSFEGTKTIKDYIDPKKLKKDYELQRILHALGVGNLELDSIPQNLSGGERTKLALAKALIAEPENLLLDEPTNYLDSKGKRWLANFLGNYPKSFILVSHDINLLDRYINKVILINTQTKKIEEYKGNYSNYQKIKEKKEKLLKREIKSKNKHIENMEKSLQRLYGHTSKKGVRQRVIVERRIETMKDKLPILPKELKKMKIILPTPANVGGIPISVKGISKSYDGKFVLRDISFSISKNERVAFIGPNGSGKSTLIKILIGKIMPEKGEVFRDQNLKIGYYSQDFENLTLNKKIIEFMRESTSLSLEEIRKILARFNFTGDQVFQTINTLSGGEKTRLSMALILSQDYNILILDEPTTHLDVLSQRIILDSLKDYKGSLIVVSHTEEFIEELDPQRVLLLPENTLKYWSMELLSRISLI
jgi:ATP-binding cassette subfamily F protein 3